MLGQHSASAFTAFKPRSNTRSRLFATDSEDEVQWMAVDVYSTWNLSFISLNLCTRITPYL